MLQLLGDFVAQAPYWVFAPEPYRLRTLNPSRNLSNPTLNGPRLVPR